MKSLHRTSLLKLYSGALVVFGTVALIMVMFVLGSKGLLLAFLGFYVMFAGVSLWCAKKFAPTVYLIACILLMIAGGIALVERGISLYRIGMIIGGVVGIPGFWVVRDEIKKATT